MEDKEQNKRVEQLVNDGLLDEAARELKTGIQRGLADVETYLLLGNLYEQIAERDSNTAMFLMAANSYRQAIALKPDCEKYHDILIAAMSESGDLGTLAAEYAKKLSENPNDVILQRCLKKIKAISLTKVDNPAVIEREHPKFLRIFFDILILPLSLVLIILSLMVQKCSTLWMRGIVLLGFYFAYKIINSLVTGQPFFGAKIR